jgi:predicted ATP-grasp superfamily ATP-dependent carboligase
VLINDKTSYLGFDYAHLCDKIWFIKEETRTIDDSDVVIACCDDALPFLCSVRLDNNIRTDKGLYLQKISAPHRIEDFYLDLDYNTPDEALSWSRDKFPIFIKPVSGCGSQGVFPIFSKIELEEMIKDTIVNKQQKTLLLQKKVYGKEMHVDITTNGSQIAVIAIWSVERGPRTFSYLENYEDQSEEFKKSLTSLLEAIPKIDKLLGSYHIQTIFDGIDLKLIEINFRHQGHITWHLYKKAVGHAQIESELIAHLAPRIWRETFANKTFPRKKYAARVWIKNRLRKYIEFDTVNLLSTVSSADYVIPHSKFFSKISEPSTEFLGSNLAAVMLVNDSEEILKQDIEKVFRWAEERFG